VSRGLRVMGWVMGYEFGSSLVRRVFCGWIWVRSVLCWRCPCPWPLALRPPPPPPPPPPPHAAAAAALSRAPAARKCHPQSNLLHEETPAESYTFTLIPSSPWVTDLRRLPLSPSLPPPRLPSSQTHRRAGYRAVLPVELMCYCSPEEALPLIAMADRSEQHVQPHPYRRVLAGCGAAAV
jgi:hypothetical protein